MHQLGLGLGGSDNIDRRSLLLNRSARQNHTTLQHRAAARGHRRVARDHHDTDAKRESDRDGDGAKLGQLADVRDGFDFCLHSLPMPRYLRRLAGVR
jgi:hypothetical protein